MRISARPLKSTTSGAGVGVCGGEGNSKTSFAPTKTNVEVTKESEIRKRPRDIYPETRFLRTNMSRAPEEIDGARDGRLSVREMQESAGRT